MILDPIAPIGMLDSGVGGISVLREAVRQLPHEHFLFYGDTANAPYGTKTPEEVQKLAGAVVEKLLQRGVKAIVIACNTATSAAAAMLRERYDLPIIGMEPALKPAHQLHGRGMVLCMATPGTIRGEKYQKLYAQYGEGVTSLPCPGLMELVEQADLNAPALHEYLERLLAPYRPQPIEAVVLGCTHYVFLKDVIPQHLPGVPLIDGNEGTIRQLHRRLEELNILTPEKNTGTVELLSSAGETGIAAMEKMFHLP